VSDPKTSVDGLVSRGVQHYRAGRLLEAMGEWEHALELDPGEEAARDYLAYVRRNFDSLSSEFQAGRSVPLSLARGAAAGSGELEIDLELEPAPTRSTMEIGSGLLGEIPDLGLVEPGDGAVDLDLDSREKTQPRARRPSSGSVSDFDVSDASKSDFDLSEMALGGASEPSPGAGTIDLGLAGDDQAVTVQRRSPIDFSDIGLPGDDDDVATVQRSRPIDLVEEDETLDLRPALSSTKAPDLGIADFTLEGPETVDLGLSRETTKFAVPASGGILSPMEAMRRDILAEADAGGSPTESREETVRRRVGRLLDRAAQEHARGRGQIAVIAANLAFDEAPSSVVAQKLVHEQRPDLQKVFIGYLGGLEGIPVLSRPLSELGSGIDSRDAFLLTQVDGLLSFGDIVDVSGMPAIDAYRTLCRMLIDGVIHIS